MKLKKEKRKQKASDSEVRSCGASPRTSKRAKIIITIKRERERKGDNHFKKEKKKSRITKKSFKIRFYSKIKIKFEIIKNSTYTFIFT